MSFALERQKRPQQAQEEKLRLERLWQENLEQERLHQERLRQENLEQERLRQERLRQERTRQEQQEKLSLISTMRRQLTETLTNKGYNPPAPPPLLAWREGTKILASYEAQPDIRITKDHVVAIKQELDKQALAANKFIASLKASIKNFPMLSTKLKGALGKIDLAINNAEINLDAPQVSEAITQK